MNKANLSSKSLTSIDYWAFRLKIPPIKVKTLLTRLFRDIGDFKIEIISTKTGWQGYKTKCLIQLAGRNLGIIAYGGESQKEWVYVGLSGLGCQYLSDINRANEMVAVEPTYQLRRVDIALTVIDGSITHESILDSYEKGEFITSVRRPKMSQILPSEKYDGRTIYIGSRSGNKFLRCYEKGYEMIKDIADHHKKTVTQCEISPGVVVPIEDIYRVELELKAKDCDLPLDLIPNRDNYFSGSYPCLEALISSSPMTIPSNKPKDALSDLETALDNIKEQYGPILFTALSVYGGDIGHLMSRIVGDRHSKSLAHLGVLIE